MATKRAASQERTRQRLVDAARALFVREGYQQTPLGRVASEAGFTKGAVYANFASKHALGLAVLDAERGRHALEIARALDGASGSLVERLDAVDGWARRVLGDREWVALEVELALALRTDAAAMGQLAERNAAVRRLLASTLQRLRQEFDLTFLVDTPEEAADVVLGLGVGVGTLRSVDPGLSVDAFSTTVRTILGIPAAV